ncbi:hypothetical protein D3C71_2132170 [compost metagenome]
MAATRQAISPRLAISKVSNMNVILAVILLELRARIARWRYMRKTPNLVSSMGAFNAADKARPSTRRVSAGAMMPSSQSRAVA